LYLGFEHCCQNIIISMPLLFTFCIHLWEGTSLPQISVYVHKYSVMWNSVKWISLVIFHHNSPTISSAETVYETHVSVFICKCITHFDYDHTSLECVQESHSSSSSLQ
jgi:hypothetical protein